MTGFNVAEFGVLLGLALMGVIAVIPYSMSLGGDRLKQAKLPPAVLMLLSIVQNGVLMGIAAAVGLLAAHAIGLGAPYIEAALGGNLVSRPFVNVLPISIGIGALCFLVMALLERFWFAPHVPAALRSSDAKAKVWTRFLASFYGGIDEEILTRLFLVSGLAWVISRVWHNAGGVPADGALWMAIVLAAVLFGLGHLPATRGITPLTTMLVTRAVVLNGIAGIAFGWLFWQYGLEAAMVGHFCADILLHVMGPVFIKQVYGEGENERVGAANS